MKVVDRVNVVHSGAEVVNDDMTGRFSEVHRGGRFRIGLVNDTDARSTCKVSVGNQEIMRNCAIPLKIYFDNNDWLYEGNIAGGKVFVEIDANAASETVIALEVEK